MQCYATSMCTLQMQKDAKGPSRNNRNHEDGEEHRLILFYYEIIHCYCFRFDSPFVKNLGPGALESARGSPKLSAAPEIRSRFVHVLRKAMLRKLQVL